LTFPVAWAIAFMLSHVMTPESASFAPTTTCQSAAGQAPLARESKS
jgi:hypothetical protein